MRFECCVAYGIFFGKQIFSMTLDSLLSSYMFDLPPGLIAQHPASERDASRLMHIAPDGSVEERRFSDLPGLLRCGDVLVRNDVRVFPARLLGKRGGGGQAELLLVRSNGDPDDEQWLCLVRPANRFKEGRTFSFGRDAELTASPRGRGEDGMIWVEFSVKGRNFLELLERIGQIPLPPYIDRPDKRPERGDALRYQTIYANHPGAVAAPTAGLHFTPAVDQALRGRGVEIVHLTLNVGPGTFRPIKSENLDGHHMHSEWYGIDPESWRRIISAREAGGRVVAVGTTSARALESAASLGVLSGWTELFIRPGYRFRVVDGMVTNFHLPGSSLLVMIAALAGRERVLRCYARAIREGWRFYSYGDAMLVWPSEERR